MFWEYMVAWAVIVLVVVWRRHKEEPKPEPKPKSEDVSLPDFIGHLFEWKKYAALSKMAEAGGRLGAAAKYELQTREFFIKLVIAKSHEHASVDIHSESAKEVCRLVDQYPGVAVAAMLEGLSAKQFLNVLKERADSDGLKHSMKEC